MGNRAEAKGKPRKDADLAEITGMLDLTGWPDGMRVIVRREPIHPKYARELKPHEKKTGYHYQAIATNTEGGQLQFLDARARSHTHVEAGIHRSKALSLNLMPSKSFAINQARCTLLALAIDLARWFQLLAVQGKLARAEPATLRNRLLDAPAKLTAHARRRELKLDPDRPATAHVPPCLERGPGPDRPRLTASRSPQDPEGGDPQDPRPVEADDHPRRHTSTPGRPPRAGART
ncbi:transposase [Streptomyces sp. NBC_01537]|uniref:transposase n=1 Tax=Streptomyces sp. NBC_01537 TaxID=2903896 RepID=UPI00387092D0